MTDELDNKVYDLFCDFTDLDATSACDYVCKQIQGLTHIYGPISLTDIKDSAGRLMNKGLMKFAPHKTDRYVVCLIPTTPVEIVRAKLDKQK